MTHLRTGLLLAQLALIAAPGLAFGQTAPTMPIEQVKDCLCQQQQQCTDGAELGRQGASARQCG